jgi:hypothetical protein
MYAHILGNIAIQRASLHYELSSFNYQVSTKVILSFINIITFIFIGNYPWIKAMDSVTSSYKN